MNKIMNLKRWIILSIYFLLSFITPLILLLILGDKINKDVIVCIPIIILLITFIIFNVISSGIVKLKFQNEKNPVKNKKIFENQLANMKSKKNYFLILMATELVVIIIMGTIVYTMLG